MSPTHFLSRPNAVAASIPHKEGDILSAYENSTLPKRCRKTRIVLMSLVPGPTAFNISICQALKLLDGEFASMAEGIAQRRYALWLGSGISRDRVDDLKKVVARVLSHLRYRIDPTSGACPYRLALNQAIGFARLSSVDLASVDFGQPIAEWPAINTVLTNLTQEYARLLDIRIEGHPEEDYLLWDVVDVPTTFAAASAIPDCEHICIAILALEGVLEDIATANWDGLIEAAVDELTECSGTALQICVRVEDLREAPLLARLLKFHGCAVRAGANPAVYRSLLIARRSQITEWPHNPAYAAMRQQLVNLAATKPTLMIGLSAQDSNIQDVFAEACSLMAWNWPCVPPAHVFAEDALGQDQLNILKFVYREAYTRSGTEIEAGALFRAFAKPALTALVLHVLFEKLHTFSRLVDAPLLAAADHDDIKQGLILLRNRVADSADSDRLAFVRTLVKASSRSLSLFQEGETPPIGSTVYRPLGRSPIHLIASDPTLPTSGVREMAAALGILGLGDADATWRVAQSDLADAAGGALRVGTASGEARIFFAANHRASVQLEINSLVSPDDRDAIVIHSTAPVSRMARSPRAAHGRTGHAGLRNIGMAELLRDATGIIDLRHRSEK